MSENLNFEALENAIAAVELGLLDHQKFPELLTVRDGVIQRFEIAMDLSRKMILRVLKNSYALDDLAANNKTFIREGARFGLIADAESWMASGCPKQCFAHLRRSACSTGVCGRPEVSGRCARLTR